jgi:hypothetical protein
MVSHLLVIIQTQPSNLLNAKKNFFPLFFYFFFFFLTYSRQMFRKAKRISQRLGLNKDKCTVSGPVNKKDAHDYTNVKKLNEKQQPTEEPKQLTPLFVIKIERVSSSEEEDDDSISTKSTESEDLKTTATALLPKQDRPSLSKCLSAPEKANLYDTPENSLERQLSMMDTGNLELLLSMETQARMDAQAEREAQEQQQKDSTLAPRPTRIKFELPVTPPRSRSPARLAYPRARPIRSLPDEGLTANAIRHAVPVNKPRRAGWRHLFSDRDEDESKSIPLPIAIGSKVRLKMRPLPTFGHVRFIGTVDFSKGEWVGVELDHGGKSWDI